MHRTLSSILLCFVVILSAANAKTDSATSDTPTDRGIALLDQMLGEDRKIILDKLRIISPDMAHWVVNFAYGEVVTRPQLDLRTRELSTIAALTAMGTARSQLRTHIGMALKIGVTPTEILEVIMQMTVYAGFPAGLNGLRIAHDVFQEKEVKVLN